MTLREHHRKLSPRGLTLIELIVVLAILIGLGSLVIPRFASSLDDSSEIAARASLVEIRHAVTRYWSDCKYLIAEQEAATGGNQADFGIRIDDLLTNPFGAGGEYDPSIGLGWRGPYLVNLSTIAKADLPATISGDANFNDYFRIDTATATLIPRVSDPWGMPIVIQDTTAFNIDTTDPTDRPVLGELRQVRIVAAGVDNDFQYSPTDTDVFDDPDDSIDDVSITFELR